MRASLLLSTVFGVCILTDNVLSISMAMVVAVLVMFFIFMDIVELFKGVK